MKGFRGLDEMLGELQEQCKRDETVAPVNLIEECIGAIESLSKSMAENDEKIEKLRQVLSRKESFLRFEKQSLETMRHKARLLGFDTQSEDARDSTLNSVEITQVVDRAESLHELKREMKAKKASDRLESMLNTLHCDTRKARRDRIQSLSMKLENETEQLTRGILNTVEETSSALVQRWSLMIQDWLAKNEDNQQDAVFLSSDSLIPCDVAFYNFSNFSNGLEQVVKFSTRRSSVAVQIQLKHSPSAGINISLDQALETLDTSTIETCMLNSRPEGWIESQVWPAIDQELIFNRF